MRQLAHDRPTPAPAHRVHGANRPGQHAHAHWHHLQSVVRIRIYCMLVSALRRHDVRVLSEVASEAKPFGIRTPTINSVVNINERAYLPASAPSILSRGGRNAAAAAGDSPVLASPNPD